MRLAAAAVVAGAVLATASFEVWDYTSTLRAENAVMKSQLQAAEAKNLELYKKLDSLTAKIQTLETTVSKATSRGAFKRPFIDPNNLLVKSHLTVAEAREILCDPLKLYAADFVKAEKDTGVNAWFLCRLANHESGHGTYPYMAWNNCFSWGLRSGTHFRSFPECIATVAAGLKNNYLTPGGSLYNGNSIWNVNVMYAGDKQWADKILGKVR